jgi:hypothetical protein
MGILDDAIREHLDLKRKHGARDADIREIEDEAFGSADRPDPFAAGELFNEVSSAEADGPDGLGEPDLGDEEPTRLVEPEALLPSEPDTELPAQEIPAEPVSPPEGLDQIPGQVELPGQDEIPGQERLDDPLEDFHPSTEPEPPETFEQPEGAETPEPSESLEDLIAEEEPFPEDSAAPPAPPAERTAPEESDRPLIPEPESTVPDPPPPPPEEGPEPPGRARGRIDVPTQEHPPPGQTGGVPPVPPPEPESDAGPPALYDFETDEESLDSSAAAPPEDDFEALGPAEEEAPYLEEEEPYAEEPVSGGDSAVPEPGTEVRPALEDEDAFEGAGGEPEESWEEQDSEEGLWFEKGPPKDFDFDD